MRVVRRDTLHWNFKNDEVDLSMLSSIQIEAAKGVLANSMRAYIEMVSEIANQNEEEFIKALRKSFEIYS